MDLPEIWASVRSSCTGFDSVMGLVWDGVSPSERYSPKLLLKGLILESESPTGSECFVTASKPVQDTRRETKIVAPSIDG